MKTSYPGIDYGLGRTNIDHATGYSYGVISCNSIMPEALDDVDPDYGTPQDAFECPECGKKYNDAAFQCSCGFKRDPYKRITLTDKEKIRVAWKCGRTEEWICAKFQCSNRLARQNKPLSMKKRSLTTS